MASDTEIQRAVMEAIKKHLRDEALQDAMTWLRVRVEAYRALERLG